MFVPHVFRIALGFYQFRMGRVAVYACRLLGSGFVRHPAYVLVTILFDIPYVEVALPGVHALAAVHVLVRRGYHVPASDARCLRLSRFRLALSQASQICHYEDEALARRHQRKSYPT